MSEQVFELKTWADAEVIKAKPEDQPDEENQTEGVEPENDQEK